VFSALDNYMWKLLYKWIKRTHPNKSRWWRMERYFDRFNRPRNNRWVFGDKDTGAYLPKFAWTKIVRHVMVTGTASPDDPDLARSWPTVAANSTTDRSACSCSPSSKLSEDAVGRCGSGRRCG
jgi:Group II intron, maturase-specific domain